MRISKTLPNLIKTPQHWAQEVLENPIALLCDQAYLEKKAANNALEFLNLWPGTAPPSHWLSSIAKIAKDETIHLQMVLKLLEKRSGHLERSHKNPYAADLRNLIRGDKTTTGLADRLLVSALIEARSCERFERLGEACLDNELTSFYSGLVTSENGHFLLFIEMASMAIPNQEVELRWIELLKEESKIIQKQPKGFRIHSGYSDS